MYFRPAAYVITEHDMDVMAFTLVKLRPMASKLQLIKELRELVCDMVFENPPFEGARPGNLRCTKEAVDAHYVDAEPLMPAEIGEMWRRASAN